MAEIRFIADTHFGHANVIKFDNRPFKTIEEHDEALITYWNETVDEKDTTYILGDFCWKTEMHWFDLLQKLKGKKFLVKGNHDLKTMTTKTQNCFIGIEKGIQDLKYHGNKIIMCHFPILTYPYAISPNGYMLHGHVHNSIEHNLVVKWTKEERLHTPSFGHIINVGCMMPWMNYRPRTIEEIVEGWRKECETKTE